MNVMKKLLIFSLCFSLQPVLAQNEQKPSWSEDLPEKVEAPDMEVLKETRKKIELDLDMSDFVRPDLETQDAPAGEQADTEAEAVKDASQEAERLAEEQRRQEEAARLAEEQRRQEEAARLAEEQRRQEEAARLAEEQRRQEPSPATSSQPDPVSSEAGATYVWKFIHQVAPDYPVKAFRERKEGWVDVDVTIAPDGTVVDAVVVRIYRNLRIFAKPALKAVRQWRFDPPQDHGIEQPQTRRYRVEFKLDDEARARTQDSRSIQAGV